MQGLDKTQVLHLLPHKRVQVIKYMIQRKLKVPWRHERLMHGTTQLENDRTIANYNLEKNSTRTLMLSVCGGPPKRPEFAPTSMQTSPNTVIHGVREATAYQALHKGQRHRAAVHMLQQY